MIDQELLKKERKQWRENSLLQSKAILTLSQELDKLRITESKATRKIIKIC